jgi:hypothetical protein
VAVLPAAQGHTAACFLAQTLSAAERADSTKNFRY